MHALSHATVTVGMPTQLAMDVHGLRHFGQFGSCGPWPPLKPTLGRPRPVYALAAQDHARLNYQLYLSPRRPDFCIRTTAARPQPVQALPHQGDFKQAAPQRDSHSAPVRPQPRLNPYKLFPPVRLQPGLNLKRAPCNLTSQPVMRTAGASPPVASANPGPTARCSTTPQARPPTWGLFSGVSRGVARLAQSSLPAARLSGVVGPPSASNAAPEGREERQHAIRGEEPLTYCCAEHLYKRTMPIYV